MMATDDSGGGMQSQNPENLVKQPNSHSCFACGIKNQGGLQMHFYEQDEMELVAHHTVPKRFEGYPDVVHGGIVASMLDEMVSRSAMIEDHNRFWMTAKLEIRYRKPTPTNVSLTLRSRVVQKKGRIRIASGEIYLPDGTVVADAKGIMVAVKDFSMTADELAELGWEVVPEPIDNPSAVRGE